MFCRNCAEVMLDTDITCPKCGFAAGTGMKYCASCGSETPVGTVICEICGQPVGNTMGGGGDMQFQAQPQPDFQQQFQQQPQFQQQFQQQPQFQQQFQQQPQFQQTQFQQPQAFQPQSFQQGGAQQFRSADPNAAGFTQNISPVGGAYSTPNTFQQNTGSAQYFQQQNIVYKSKTAAGVLGILFGAFGVHNFYLGYTTKAVVQLLLTVLSCGALAFVPMIWGLVEGIQILTGKIDKDARGLPLKD